MGHDTEGLTELVVIGRRVRGAPSPYYFVRILSQKKISITLDSYIAKYPNRRYEFTLLSVTTAQRPCWHIQNSPITTDAISSVTW